MSLLASECNRHPLLSPLWKAAITPCFLSLQRPYFTGGKKVWLPEPHSSARVLLECNAVMRCSVETGNRLMVHFAGLINSCVEVEEASSSIKEGCFPGADTPDNLRRCRSLYSMVYITGRRTSLIHKHLVTEVNTHLTDFIVTTLKHIRPCPIKDNFKKLVLDSSMCLKHLVLLK